MIDASKGFAAAMKLAQTTASGAFGKLGELNEAVEITKSAGGAGAPGGMQLAEAVSAARNGPLGDLQKSVAYLDFARVIGERAGNLPPQLAQSLEDARAGAASAAKGLSGKLDQGGIPALKKGGGLDQAISQMDDIRKAAPQLDGAPMDDDAFWNGVGEQLAAREDFNAIGLTADQAKTIPNALRLEGKGAAEAAKDAKPGDLQTLQKFGTDMVEEARAGKMKPLIGRDNEVRDAIEVLAKKEENNPIFTGEAGVGKTAIAEGMAQRIAKGDVPRDMQGAKLFQLDMTTLAGQSPDETAKNLQAVIADVKAAREDGQKVYVFIDEIHTIMKDKQIADVLKPAMARGDFPIIGATTSTEFREILKDPALERRFGEIKVEEPKPDEAKSIVRGVKPFYEKHHKVDIDESGVNAAVDLTGRYIKDKDWPGKALKALDEASAEKRLTLTTEPRELDMLNRRIDQLSREQTELSLDTTGASAKRMKIVESDRFSAQMEARKLRAGWNEFRGLVDQHSELDTKVNDLATTADDAEKAGDYATAAQIRYAQMPQAGEQRQAISDRIAKLREANPTLPSITVSSDDVAGVIARWRGVDIGKMGADDSKRYLELEDTLHKTVIGQENAIHLISEAMQRNKTGLSSGKRPIGTFILSGSSGVGKTELAKALEKFISDSDSADGMIRFDMGNFKEPHSVSKLIGSPPGYIGSDEGGQLTEAIRKKPFSVIVFDEAEKAHPKIWETLYPLMDEGYMVDAKGKKADFTNSVIILTSNLGSDYIDGKEVLDNATKAKVTSTIKNFFPAAFLGRMDEVMVADPLSRDQLRKIVSLNIKPLQQTLEKKDIGLTVTDNAQALIAATGYKPELGARPVQGNIRKMLESQLSKPMLEGTLGEGKTAFVDVDASGEHLTFQFLDTGSEMPKPRDVTVDYDAIAAKSKASDEADLAGDMTDEEMRRALQGANDGSDGGPAPVPQAAPDNI